MDAERNKLVGTKVNQCKKMLSSICYRRILQIFENTVHRHEDSLEKVIVQRKVARQRSRGGWLDRVKDKTNRTQDQRLHRAKNRVR